MDEPSCITKQFLEKLEESFKKFENVLKNELEKSVDNTLKKDFFDNASKTSSGYDDEEFNDDEQEADRRAHLHEGEDDDDILIISDDENYNEIWEIDSVSTDDEAYIEETTCSSCTQKKEKLTFFKILNTLPYYPPSEEIKLAKNSNFTAKSLQENNTEMIKTFITDSKLHKYNIESVYKMMLEIEDVTDMSEYPPLAQKDVVLNCTGMAREYWICLKNCPDIDDIVAPFMDEVVLVPKASSAISEVIPLKYMTDLLLPHEHESPCYEDLYRRRVATVQQISKERAYFRFSKEEHLSAKQVGSLVTTKYDIIFRPRRYPLRYQHRALELLAESDDMRHFLFPTENPYKELVFQPQLNMSLFNTTIASNPEQLEAVHYITEGPNSQAPFVIFGPPGTGKTTTTVESILQLRLHHPRSRILVTAGSNSACDTIALRICKYFKSNPRLQQLEIRDPKNQKSLIRIYSKSVIEKGVHLIDSELLDNSNCKGGIHHYPSVKEIRQYGIIVATLCTVGKLVTGDVGEMNFFTHIFMDEAGASTEPEALVGIMGIKSHTNCRVILSGDHKQLGPILKSERAAQLGLERSLLERLLNSPCYAIDANCNYDRTVQARLKRNYRSHPEIVRLYNHLYYNDELIAEAKLEDVNLAAKWCKLPNPNFPIIFQAVHGVTEKDTLSPSSFNNLEIQVLMWFLQRLLVDGIHGQKVEQTDIGIITPYRLQSKRIQNRLNGRGWSGVESGSVETFQGREKQIIIVSLVRSFAGLGFVRNPKRLNVILSRPKSLLILMGNPLTLRRHADFAFIMDECKKHGTFLRKKKTRKPKIKLAPRRSSSLLNLSSLSLTKATTTATNTNLI
ncbi:putative helicase mov-10-B.1 [Calliphora vicina]|uniref:putative helicase mov-10-B.1 n=1 Tax=Calliphora vicina TaxID=7373 RepID=UPI00325B36CC